MSLERLGPSQSQSGSHGAAPVEDTDAVSLLNGILTELKILNLHMAILTDNHFKESDV